MSVKWTSDDVLQHFGDISNMRDEVRELQSKIDQSENSLITVLADCGFNDCLSIRWGRVRRRITEMQEFERRHSSAKNRDE